MKRLFSLPTRRSSVGPRSASGVPSAGGPAGGRLDTHTFGRLRSAFRQVFGIPDYERYLEHMAEHHPGEPTLCERDFFAQAIDRKYGKSGPRCC
jgi:uncharacterized short protein YbdD (DUF466 family)